MGTVEPALENAYGRYRVRTPKSASLWRAATGVAPLGVHSNYRYLEPYPFYVRRAHGTWIEDADGNEYLDFNMAFGSLQSGHAHPALVRALSRQLTEGSIYGYEWDQTPAVAERLCRRFGMARVRFSTTGLEATHHAIRIARAFTGRADVIKFEGGYHGSHDTLLVGVKPTAENAGDRRHPRSAPAGPGMLRELTDHTVVAPFNDLDAVREIARAHRTSLAAIIVEPIPMNMGFILPVDGFLPGLRELCNELGALLIFDEVKTGAKYPRGGAGRMGVRPDMMTLGKSIACGIPVSAIAARDGVMDQVGPRRIAHAGTYNANPLAMTACRVSLEEILTDDALGRCARLNERLAAGYREVVRDAHVTAEIAADGVSGTIFFSDHPVTDWRSFLTVDGDRSMLYYYSCLNEGLIPSGTGPDEQWTISVQHTAEEVDRHLAILRAIAPVLKGAPRAGEIEESV